MQFRLVRPDDAAYVVSLRINSAYNTHLSSVSDDVEAQRVWIEAYKDREAAGSEYYFIIETQKNLPCGVVRIYDIKDSIFTWGSWILDHNKPHKAALESAFLIYWIAFEMLGLDRAVFEVMRENNHTLAFHERFGARETGRDSVNVYFDYTRTQFAADKPEFIATLEGHV